MTTLAMEFNKLRESKRANKVDEAERERANRTREEETYRSNKTKELETERSNRAKEALTNEQNKIKRFEAVSGAVNNGIKAIQENRKQKLSVLGSVLKVIK